MARARSSQSRLAFLCAAAVALSLLAAPGCRRRASPEFNQASILFTSLTNQLGDDAYGDPQMAEVERLLALVPGNSLDAQAAAELKQRIAAGRAAFAERSSPASPGQDPASAPPADPWANWKPPPPEDAGQPDAGYPHPVIGMAMEEVRRRFSDCFAFRESVVIEGRGRHDVWAVKATDECRQAHPGYEQRLLVLDPAGKAIMGVAPASSLQVGYYYPDGGEAPPPPPGK